MGEKINAYKVLVGKHKEKDYLEGTGVDWKIILKWMI